MNARRQVAALLCLVLLAGCASIPLGTLWKLRDFDADSLAGLDPAQLRVATRIDPAPLRIRPGSMQLTLTLRPRAEGVAEEVHAFGMREARAFHPALVPADQPRWQAYELDAAGIAAMTALQPRLKDVKRDYREAAFSVKWQVDGDPPPSREAALSVRLQLSQQQAPMTLFDRMRIEYRGDEG